MWPARRAAEVAAANGGAHLSSRPAWRDLTVFDTLVP
jgi:hypothetical protein